ncbi:MAG: flagellar motor switch protein FliM, partial [Rhodospirillaceae bacterium]|nr:flagellar motor switch protein FliM [Rhodospirillaceae bacterium]
MVPPSEDDEVDIMAEMDSIAPDDDGDEADSMAAEWEAMLGGDDDDDLGGMG